jgi:cytochrome c553
MNQKAHQTAQQPHQTKPAPKCGVCHEEKGKGSLQDAYGTLQPCPKCNY